MIQGTAAFIVNSVLILPISSTTTSLALLSTTSSSRTEKSATDLTTNTMTTQGVNLFKNFNPYWGAVTGLAFWFLLWHTPTFWKNRHISRDLVLAVYIVAAGTIYLACVHNCLITPSLHPIAKISHTWIGRLGLLSGIVSFSLGFFLAWSRLALLGSSSTDDDAVVVGSTTLGFSIPITIGGILQIVCEVQGFRAIRKFKRIKQ
jgi:hypothetical protein